MTQIRWGGKWVHLAYIWIVSHLSAKNYRNLWKFDEVLTKTNLLSYFGTRCSFLSRGVAWVHHYYYFLRYAALHFISYHTCQSSLLLSTVTSSLFHSTLNLTCSSNPSHHWLFTAMHAMQTRSSDENSVGLSVRPSVCPSHACIVTKQ